MVWDDESLAAQALQVRDYLESEKLTLAVAESCTGGWLAKLMTDIAGSSEWFDRGFVTYSNQAKQQMLGVRGDTLEQYGAVSQAIVEEMVLGVLEHSNADIATAVSGIAGPGGGSPEKPVGTVWLAWGSRKGSVISELRHFTGDREQVRRQSVSRLMEGILAGGG